MDPLVIFISLYISISVLIGLYCTKFINNSSDFCFAGRNLPILLCSSTMFSTWFGAETIVGASSEFLEHGLLGVIEDPFGTSLCFLLIGLFFARKIYSLNMTTIVDLFKLKYGQFVEKLSAIFMIISYIGWIAAQLVAMGIIMQLIFNITVSTGIIISASIVCFYTVSGGMWSISINDFIQTVVIILGLIAICIYLSLTTDPVKVIINNAPTEYFNIIPKPEFSAWLKYIVAWMTIGLGSIPQQDVFQRIMSARNQQTAIISSYLAAILYILIGCLPFLIATALYYSNPSLQILPYDQVLLQGILHNQSLLLKTFFFGALLSAIMSSASGAILAPATILAENIVKPTRQITDKTFLLLLRASVLLTVIVSSIYAIYTPNVYMLVAESSIISLVSLFIPLVAALYWTKASPLGAILAIILGPLAWIVGKALDHADLGVLTGLIVSLLTMVIASRYYAE